MYKFRTLAVDAEKRLGGTLLSSDHRLETRTGRFLRETRLDELPQLINVVLGDMELVGPRPERPEVYDNLCRHIPDYDKRFGVKPGIIGYSQLFTPHSAPKRARTLVDNYYVRRRQRWGADLPFFLGALFWIAFRAATKTVSLLSKRFSGHLRGAELRASDRVSLSTAEVWLADGSGNPLKPLGPVDDISDKGLSFVAEYRLPADTLLSLRVRVEGYFPPRTGLKRKTARCQATLLRVDEADGGWRHVVIYNPERSVDALILHKYFLDKSIA